MAWSPSDTSTVLKFCVCERLAVVSYSMTTVWRPFGTPRPSARRPSPASFSSTAHRGRSVSPPLLQIRPRAGASPRRSGRSWGSSSSVPPGRPPRPRRRRPEVGCAVFVHLPGPTLGSSSTPSAPVFACSSPPAHHHPAGCSSVSPRRARCRGPSAGQHQLRAVTGERRLDVEHRGRRFSRRASRWCGPLGTVANTKRPRRRCAAGSAVGNHLHADRRAAVGHRDAAAQLGRRQAGASRASRSRPTSRAEPRPSRPENCITFRRSEAGVALALRPPRPPCPQAWPRG